MNKVLLIDDEADVQYSFRRIFEGDQIQITTAGSGEEGLKIIPRLKPDLVIDQKNFIHKTTATNSDENLGMHKI